jgi:hypothetical protein
MCILIKFPSLPFQSNSCCDVDAKAKENVVYWIEDCGEYPSAGIIIFTTHLITQNNVRNNI